MRSSDALPRRGGAIVAWTVAVLAGLVVAVVRPAAAERFHRLRVTSDVYPLAAPDQMVVASLGYRAALADLIFAHVLVSYGIHFQEKRRFEFVADYLETINALDPTFREAYRLADTLIVFGPEPARQVDYRRAREILEKGTRARPFDTELWLTAGQYLAYIAPPFLPESVRREWKLEGAKLLARACELASSNENVPYHCITAARLFENVGEREAAIESLQRLLAVSDDPGIQGLALSYLQKRLSERRKDKQEIRRTRFREAWKDDLPFVSKDGMLVLAPRIDPARCAGPGRAFEPGCETSWKDWARHADPTGED